MAESHTLDVTVPAMVTIVFTGDSQTCGRNLAIDYPQLLSRRLGVRVINTAVGGSNSSALLRPMTGGSLKVSRGDRLVYGTGVRWGMGPFPGMRLIIDGWSATIDAIREHPGTPHTEIVLREAAPKDYQGESYHIEPGWQERVARHNPDVVCLMYINDGAMPPAKQEDWREMIRRIRDLGAVPILLSPFPVDDAENGGNHPGTNRTYAANAAAVRDLAAAEGCWFVDVFTLTRALDPALRCVIHDGIHPDTDGQTVAIDGLLWVFEQMGLLHARPYIKGWVVDQPPPWHGSFPGMRPFRTAQPDHPTPDRQLTEGFDLAAIRDNDEYGLIAARDGTTLPFAAGLLLEIGLAKGHQQGSVRLRLAGREIGAVYAEIPPDSNTWTRLNPVQDNNDMLCDLPAAAVAENETLRLALAADEHGELDAVTTTATYAQPPPRWKPTAQTPRAYTLQADHQRHDNLVRNPAFLEENDAWEYHGQATRNHPFSITLGAVAFADPTNLRRATIQDTGKVRPFDLLALSGSQAGNDGNYRIRALLDEHTLLVRRRAHAAEDSLQAILHHNDGCGLVPGGTCVEMIDGGAVSQVLRLPARTRRLRVSFFYRAVAVDKLGTRDVPDTPVTLILSGLPPTAAIPEFRQQWPCSYQWRKADLVVPLEQSPPDLRLTLAGEPGTTLQVTGIYAAPETGD